MEGGKVVGVKQRRDTKILNQHRNMRGDTDYGKNVCGRFTSKNEGEEKCAMRRSRPAAQVHAAASH